MHTPLALPRWSDMCWTVSDAMSDDALLVIQFELHCLTSALRRVTQQCEGKVDVWEPHGRAHAHTTLSCVLAPSNQAQPDGFVLCVLPERNPLYLLEGTSATQHWPFVITCTSLP